MNRAVFLFPVRVVKEVLLVCIVLLYSRLPFASPSQHSSKNSTSANSLLWRRTELVLPQNQISTRSEGSVFRSHVEEGQEITETNRSQTLSPVVLSIPVFIENASHQVCALREGQSIVEAIDVFSMSLGIDKEDSELDRAFLADTARQRLAATTRSSTTSRLDSSGQNTNSNIKKNHFGRGTLSRRVAIIIAYEDDATDHFFYDTASSHADQGNHYSVGGSRTTTKVETGLPHVDSSGVSHGSVLWHMVVGAMKHAASSSTPTLLPHLDSSSDNISKFDDKRKMQRGRSITFLEEVIGIHIVIVTNGFSLCQSIQQNIAEMCLFGVKDPDKVNNNIKHNERTAKAAHGENSNGWRCSESEGGYQRSNNPEGGLPRGNGLCGSLTIISSNEIVGFGAAVNRAMHHVNQNLLYTSTTSRLRRNRNKYTSNSGALQAHDNLPPLRLHAIVAVISAGAPLRPHGEYFRFRNASEFNNKKFEEPGKDQTTTQNVKYTTVKDKFEGKDEDLHDEEISSTIPSELSFVASEGMDVWHAYDSLANAIGSPHSLLLFAVNDQQLQSASYIDSDDRKGEFDGRNYKGSRGHIIEGLKGENCVACAAPMPLLIFDSQIWQRGTARKGSEYHTSENGAKTSRNPNGFSFSNENEESIDYHNIDTETLGPMDEGFLLQGAVGEWFLRAKHHRGQATRSSSSSRADFTSSSSEILLLDATKQPFDFSRRFLWRSLPNHRIRKRPVGNIDENSKESFVSRVEQLAQLDVDHLYAAEILGKHCTRKKGIETDGTGGSGVDIHGVQCHMETVGAPLNSFFANGQRRRFGEAFSADLAKNRSIFDRRIANISAQRSLFLVAQEVKWQAQWMMGRMPTNIALAGWSDALTIGAVMLLYDDSLTLASLVLQGLLHAVHHTVVLVSAVPWHGHPRNVAPTLSMLSRFSNDKQYTGRLSVVTGFWPTEEAQRQFGNDLLKRMPVPGAGAYRYRDQTGCNDHVKECHRTHGYISHVLVVDGDEFWHPAELHRALCLVAHNARAAASSLYANKFTRDAKEHQSKHRITMSRSDHLMSLAAAAAAPFVRAPMATYWKSIRSVVSPPEQLQILWLVSLDLCTWTEAREINCILPMELIDAYRSDLIQQRWQQQQKRREPWRVDNDGHKKDNTWYEKRDNAIVNVSDDDVIRESSHLKYDGLWLDDSVAACHHLSYVRTTRELVDKKFASFAHAKDVVDATTSLYSGVEYSSITLAAQNARVFNDNQHVNDGKDGLSNWLHSKWRAWDKNHSLTKLHPTQPSAYWSIKKQPFYLLPPSLRRAHLRYGQIKMAERGGGVCSVNEIKENDDVVCEAQEFLNMFSLIPVINTQLRERVVCLGSGDLMWPEIALRDNVTIIGIGKDSGERQRLRSILDAQEEQVKWTEVHGYRPRLPRATSTASTFRRHVSLVKQSTISLDLVQDITPLEDQENIEEKKKKKQLVMIKVTVTILLQLRKII